MREKQLRMTPAAIGAALAGDLGSALVAATPGGIEAQEAAGQRSFVTSTTLPKDCPRKELEALGVVFGADADGLFVNVTLPTGWKKQATDHSMWSDLLDEQGRKRGGIFYKAAFYDRRADMHLNRFLSIAREYQDASGNKTTGRPEQVAIRVEDAAGAILYDAGSVAYADYQASDQADAACRAWLEEHYPLWLGPSDCVYGGFAAYVERYHMMAGRVRITDVVHADTIQDAAKQAAEQACDLSDFEAWRERWEQHAVVDL